MIDVKKMRKKMGLSQKKLAYLLGTDQALISKWETGFCFPAYKTMEKLFLLELKWENKDFRVEALKNFKKK